MNLNTLKDMASKILNKSKYKLVIDLEKLEEHKKLVQDAITKEDVRNIIAKGVIVKVQNTGQSRARARKLLVKKKLKRKKGPGRKKGTKSARENENSYNLKVRGLRKTLKQLKDENKLNDKNYNKVYLMIKGNYFRGKKHLQEYISGENK